ncbi:uncharacterized protein LOC111058430 [Nilaparvata lugens]|uniref:uncharacterized protein LOC111058430 n=1 Tax=Nilaparvata lugens TaxID=108931 RepID=UPI00193E7FB2|nr:uncharacterized protein LOC111058430 [Nilaparvata lugens]
MSVLSDAQGTPSSNNAHSPAAPLTKSPGPQISKSSWSPEASAKEKQEELQKAMSSRLEVNTKLEQERMEGVDEKEWDE